MHTIKKSLKDYGDKLEPAEKEKIEAALKDVESVLKSENKTEIEAKTQALAQAAQKLGEKVYAEEQAKKQAASQPDGPSAANEAGSQGAKKDDGNVVDAEYTEVKNKKTG